MNLNRIIKLFVKIKSISTQRITSIHTSVVQNMEPITSENLLQGVQAIIPEMTSQLHKGQCGRIGVIGGCREYTGAPYFAAISALKVGADLSHVFCTEAAAPVIKSYSPELIVHPSLDGKDGIAEVSEWLPRINSLVIGPGLGRDPAIFGPVKGILENAMKLEKPLVIDADGVYFITKEPSIIMGYKKAVLTPNGIEFIRLYEKIFNQSPSKNMMGDNTRSLAQALGGVTIVCKGETDAISDGSALISCSKQGSVRRCGGQGDLLSGSMGTFLFWAHMALQTKQDNQHPGFSVIQEIGPNLCAAYGACFLTRECNRQGYLLHKRSMTTTDMIACIHQAFETYFEK